MEKRNCEYCKRELPVFNEFIMQETFVWRDGKAVPLLYVSYGPDPFDQEVYGILDPHWLCQECCYESYMNV